ncbi:MAG: hypothetical protein RDU89_08770 [bacterium]|nr:hypothetical protein [bacterium]
MKLGVELYTETSLSVDDTTRFELHLTRSGEPVAGSRGLDRYLINGMVILGKRVAACGREAAYGHESTAAGLGLGPLEALPAVSSEIGDNYRGLKLHVDTNAVLDVGLFGSEFSLRITDPEQGRSLDIPLGRPDVRIDWESRGAFVVDLEPLLH